MRSIGKTLAAASVAALGLSSCGPLIDFGPEGTPSQVYTLTIPVGHTPRAMNDDAVLMIDAPDMPGHARGIRIPVVEGQNGITWYSGAEWSEGAPDLLRRVFRAGLAINLNGPVIGAGALDVKADCRLAMNVSQFQFRPASNEVEVAADYRLISMRKGRLIASHQTISKIPVGADTAEQVVVGYDAALSEMIGGLTLWIKDHIETCRAARD